MFLTAEGFRQRSSMMHALLSNIYAQVRFEMSTRGVEGLGVGMELGMVYKS